MPQVRKTLKLCTKLTNKLYKIKIFSPDASTPTWQELDDALKAVTAVVQGLVEFTKVKYAP